MNLESRRSRAGAWWLGLGLVVVGLASGSGAVRSWLALYWPLCLIAAGLALVVSSVWRMRWTEAGHVDRVGR